MELTGLVDELDDPAYATAIGLLLWGLEDEHPTNKGNQLEFHKMSGNLLKRARHVFKQFLP